MLAGLSEWVDSYGRAWEERDPDAVASLFTEDALHQWGPFGRKLRGRIMIREAWAEAMEQQANVQFGYEVMTATASGGIVRWWCTADLPAEKLRSRTEGILRLAFNEEGLCTSLEEWGNSTDDPLDEAT